MNNKGGPELKIAFEHLFKISNPRKPEKLQRETGKEFVNKDVQKFLKAKWVQHFVSHNVKKAALVERFNRSLKTKIGTYFTAVGMTNVYIDKLEMFVKSSNHWVHRMIGMRPADVRTKDQDGICAKLYGNYMPIPKKQSPVGGLARIS